MANKEFERLIEKRKDWVRSSKQNKFDFDSILAGSYDDPSHFIYEILQNAEDEGAKKVRFKLFENKLDVYHNGKDFDLNDIDGVTGIGISKKKEDLTSIGKFGVGFKSVFAITETPYIFSGEYKIKIEDFVVPSVVSDNEQISGTLIRFPFNHKLQLQKECFLLITKKLKNIGLRTLLFLKNIKEINWQTPSISGYYSKSSESFQTFPNARKVFLKSSNFTEEYIVIEKPIKIEGKDLKVEVAYKLGKDKSGKEIIIPEPNSELVVFFPTEKATFLSFIIQGPFKTTPNRGSIPLEDEQNKKVLEKIGNLVADSISVIKDLGYLDTNFLSLLPIKIEQGEHKQIYSLVYDKVKAKLTSQELLPTSDGKYTKAGDALLARGKELTEFLNRNDIQELFLKKAWLDRNITDDKTTRELRDYLINELEIIEVDFESFARKITDKFLQTKSDEWMIDFYTRLLGQQSLWSYRGNKSILRTKPIIRLETNEHIAPFNDDSKIQVYLPTETKSEYKTVKHIFNENENSLNFLEQLGLTTPDLFAEVKEFILRNYQEDNPIKDEKYFEDFEKMLKAYEIIPANKRRDYTRELSKLSFIDSVHNGTGDNHLQKPSKVYFNDNNLKKYFVGYTNVYFVSEDLYEKFGEERMKPFLIDLGVENKPRRIGIPGNLSWEEKSRLRGDIQHTGDIYQKDYELEGLENFLKEMTFLKSFLLWNLLLNSIETLNTTEARKYFEGNYRWWRFQDYYDKGFEAKFTKMLRQLDWFVDKNSNSKKPSDITFPELSDDYIKESPNIEILIKALGFKPEAIDQLPEDYRKKLEIVKDLTPEELEKLISEIKNKSPDKEEIIWTPEHEADKVNVVIEEVEHERIITPDLTGQGEKEEIEKEKIKSKRNEETEEDKRQKLLDKKAIGEWGEKHVYHALKKEYLKIGSITETESGFIVVNNSFEEYEIVWLNKYNDRGVGYDFIIKKNASDVEYIEVKTKTEEKPEFIEVTGTQWEFARKLFEQNEGEKYSFFVVSNAGKENVKIHKLKNPIKLWKEGKLYAHPVSFKL